jgi:hypothetical protein
VKGRRWSLPRIVEGYEALPRVITIAPVMEGAMD